MQLSRETVNRIIRGSVFSHLTAKRNEIETLKKIRDAKQDQIKRWREAISDNQELVKGLGKQIQDAQLEETEIEIVYNQIAEE